MSKSKCQSCGRETDNLIGGLCVVCFELLTEDNKRV